MRKLLDVSYSSRYPERKLDWFLPEKELAGKTCLLFIHGGGWYKGDRTQWHAAAEHFCDMGYVCVTVGYRLVPEWTYPSQLEDVRVAMQYIRGLADRYGFDPSCIAAIGSSAGGYLAMMLSMIGPEEPLGRCDELRDPDTRPAAVIAYCPVVRLNRYRETIRNFMGKASMQDYDAASPLHRTKHGLPPYLILQGDADDITPVLYARQFHEQLIEAGVKSILLELSGIGHGFGYGVASEVQKTCIRTVEDFLKEACRHHGQ